jgi:hypothetical protein
VVYLEADHEARGRFLDCIYGENAVSSPLSEFSTDHHEASYVSHRTQACHQGSYDTRLSGIGSVQGVEGPGFVGGSWADASDYISIRTTPPFL